MLDFIRHFSEKDSYVIGWMQLSTCRITLFIPYTYVCSRPEAQLSTCLVTVKRNRDWRYACFQEKYYLGYVLLEQLSIATDIQFHIFNFQICLPWLFTKKKELIVHIQCLLRVDGSIVAGVFLTSFFCVVPESPYSSDTSSSLLVAWYSNCFSAASSTSGFRNWWLFSSIDSYAVVSNQFRSQLLTIKLLL